MGIEQVRAREEADDEHVGGQATKGAVTVPRDEVQDGGARVAQEPSLPDQHAALAVLRSVAEAVRLFIEPLPPEQGRELPIGTYCDRVLLGDFGPSALCLVAAPAKLPFLPDHPHPDPARRCDIGAVPVHVLQAGRPSACGLEVRALEDCGAVEVSEAESGWRDDRGEVRQPPAQGLQLVLAEALATQVASIEADLFRVRVGDAGRKQVGVLEVGALQVRAAQVGSLEVRLLKLAP